MSNSDRILLNNEVELRPLIVADAPLLYHVIDENREFLRTWLPWVDSTDNEEVVERVIKSWEIARSEGRDHVFGIFKCRKYIGNIGIHNINKARESAEIGYWLSPQFNGQGIMTQSVIALTQFCFDSLNFNRVAIHCAESNTKSRAVPLRLKFKQEGVLEEQEVLYGVYHDLILYGMTRNRWKKVQE